VKIFALLLLLAFSILILGCQGIRLNSPTAGTSGDPAGASGQAAPREFVYVANLGSLNNPGGSISGFLVNQQTGGLVPVPGSPFPAGDSPGAITSDPAGHHVFVIEKKFSLVSGFCSEAKGILLSENIESHSGKLGLAEKVTLDGFCPQSLAVDPEGETLYVSEETSSTGAMLDGGEIQAFAIGQDGALKEIPGSPFPVAGGASALAIHPGGKLLYLVTGTDGQGIVVFDRDAETGKLGPARPFAVRSEAHLAIVPSGRLMIAENASNIDQVILYNIDLASGELTPQPPMARSLPWAVAVDRQGGFAALAVASPGTIGLPGEIQIFRIDDSASTMTQVPGNPTAAGNAPLDVKFDLQGNWSTQWRRVITRLPDLCWIEALDH
jgi:6-phosphogluconolactonase (cycloisomerase 2 family)